MECNECKSKNVRINGYESYCLDCGLVEDYFEQQSTATQLSNAIGTHKAGRIVRASSLLTWKEKNVAKATWLLKLIESKLMLPNIVVQDALYIYRALLEKNLIAGRSIEALICACVYIAAKRNNHELSFDDFKRYNVIKVDKVKKAQKFISRNLGLRIEFKDIEGLLIDAFYKFDLPKRAKKFATKLLLELRKKNQVTGKTTKIITATILYFTSKKFDLGLSQRLICSYFLIRHRHLRKNYWLINEALK